MSAGKKDIPKLAVSIEPIGDRVVVHPLEKETTTASGIVIPETASGEKPQEGVVLALGKGGIGKDTVDPTKFLKVGDRVLFGKYAGDDVKLKGADGKDVEVKVLHIDSILGIVR
ncbi:MAG: co-chaperone GroES [Candidatus Peribacteraceae bacterium]|nr:co-chaperone GroES [Candidatus Peribacteraceae bacterium]